jgi:hypothetical protein
MVTVPVEETPPVTVVGLSVTFVGVGAFTVTVAEIDLPFAVALTVAVVFAATGTPVTLNVTVVAPAATRTLAGTAAAAEESRYFTVALRIYVQVAISHQPRDGSKPDVVVVIARQ